MKARLVTWAAVWLVCGTVAARPAFAATEVYDIDEAHTSIVFSVSHTNMSFTYGMFRKSEGRFMLDTTNPANSRFQIRITAESIDTNNPERDKHLKSPDFFNVQQFPTITFDSTSVAQTRDSNGVEYHVTGNLTMHGVTREITIPLKVLGQGQGPYGKYRTGFWTQIELKRSDYGMTNLPQFVGDVVGITISFEGIRQEPGGAQPARPQP
jgi:polyisoprenoid-binding protein YceI